MVDKGVSDSMSDGKVVDKKNPVNNFSKNILRSLIGEERAKNAMSTISMQNIPNQDKSISIESKIHCA
jgi:hypothetical protein